MSPGVREAALSTKARAMMRKPRTLHCPYCDGKVLFTRNEEHLDEKNCPHCGMKVVRRDWPQGETQKPPGAKPPPQAPRGEVHALDRAPRSPPRDPPLPP